MTEGATPPTPRTEAGKQAATDVSRLVGFEGAAPYWQQRIAMIEGEAVDETTAYWRRVLEAEVGIDRTEALMQDWHFRDMGVAR